MPRAARKKQKTAHVQRTSPNRVLPERNQLEQPSKSEENNFDLFGKCIPLDEHGQQAAYYAKLRFWHRHAISERSEDSPVPRMSGIAATASVCASPSTSRHNQQEQDVPLSIGSCVFQTMPPPSVTDISPFPIIVPLQQNVTLPTAYINDPRAVLERHKARWKMVRKNWILHRQLYMQRYSLSFEFIESTNLQFKDE